MDFELTDDQRELRDVVRSVLVNVCPPSVVRQVFEAKEGEESPVAGLLWRQMVDLDWPALTIPAAFGGLGLGYVELAIVAEELGRSVVPSPFLATLTQFAPMIRESGSPQQQDRFLRPIAERGRTGTLGLAEDAGRWEMTTVATTARPTEGGWLVDGRKAFVLDGTTADEIALVARLEGTKGLDGLGVFVVPTDSGTATQVSVIDPTQPVAELSFDGLAVPDDRVLLAPGDPRSPGAITRAVEEATAAIALAMCGTCRAIFEITLQYVKDRHQYERPIGSFQAVKHRMVDMYLAVERATSLAYFAALAIAEDDDRRGLAVAMAKAAAGECQRLVVQEGLQLHGGIGLTWEHDLHLFLKRAKSADEVFGSALTQRSVVAQILGLHLAAVEDS
jgi:alkylation response protein AidB-like acyl-CoA dehydrogenase